MTLRTLLTAMVLVTLPAGAAWSGAGYDSCVKEEKRLRQKEVDQCSGFSYMLNPSACFTTRKALAEQAGKCREIALAEGVKPAESRPPAAKPAATPVPANAEPVQPPPATEAPTPVTVSPPTLTPAASSAGQSPAVVAAPGPAMTLEELQAENARLKDELHRLRTEIEQLKKGRP